jgi:hypothetical protein
MDFNLSCILFFSIIIIKHFKEDFSFYFYSGLNIFYNINLKGLHGTQLRLKDTENIQLNPVLYS